MNILDKIVARKQQEVAEVKTSTPINILEESKFFSRQPISIKERFRKQNGAPGIIAEFKRKSPSKGMINEEADLTETVVGYVKAGVTGLSILTDEPFFGGNSDFIVHVRNHTTRPILRKDFMLDEYQVVEAKAIGADVILLIAAILTPEQINRLAELAHSLGMEVLLEVHNREELEKSVLNEGMGKHLDLVGVNNRNLKTFNVSLNTSEELNKMIPDEYIKISESGISNPEAIHRLSTIGYQGFLIGEHFMAKTEPALACQHFMHALTQKV
jgi:indole-3-glycerol phosphate synthase